MALDDLELIDTPDDADLELGELADIEFEGAEEDIPVVYDDLMATNLVPTLVASQQGKQFLRDTCSEVIDMVQDALDESEEYRNESVKILKMFMCDVPKKSFPFEDAANVHMPIVFENVLLIAFQSWSELFPNWQQVFTVMPMGEADRDVAEALTIHGNWQIREQLPGFKNELARGLIMFYLFGDVPCHSYYTPSTGLNCHEMLTPDEFVTPYALRSSLPDYGDLPWYCKRLWLHKHDMERRRGEWEDVDAVLEKKAASWDSDNEPTLAVSANRAAGLDQPTDDARAPFEIYQWEGWLTLPEIQDQRWCQVFVDPRTRIVLQLRVYEQENWQDRARYNMELQQRDDYFAARAEFELAGMQRQAQQEVLGQAAQMGDVVAGMQLEELSMQPEPEEPMAPEWMASSMLPGEEPDPQMEPAPVRMEPIRLFAHGVNIQPPAGNRGIGHGKMQAHFNRATNTLYNQFVDAGTLANCHTLLTTESVEFERPFSVGPGKINRVRGVGPNMSDHVQPLSFPGANPQLAEMADRIYAYAKGAAQANDVLAGDSGKSGESAKLHQARLAQATKMISVPAERFRDFFEAILKNNAKLNALFLRDEELFWVANEVTQMKDQKEVRRSWYDRSYSVEIRADLTFEPKEARISQADTSAALVISNPITASDASIQYAALKRQLEARGERQLIALLPPPPKPGMPLAMYLTMLAMGPPGMGQALGLMPGGAPGQAPPEQRPQESQANPAEPPPQGQMPAGPPQQQQQ